MTLSASAPQTKSNDVPRPGVAERDSRLLHTAQAYEASFLAEMLKHAGVGKTYDGLASGTGDDAFSTLLIEQRARQMVENGGIGLADGIFETLKRMEQE